MKKHFAWMLAAVALFNISSAFADDVDDYVPEVEEQQEEVAANVEEEAAE